MNENDLRALLHEVREGALHPEAAVDKLKLGPFQSVDLGFAHLDLHRGVRHRIGEVVYGEGKTLSQLLAIVERLAESGKAVLSTRLDDEKLEALSRRFSGGRANRHGRTFTVNPPAPRSAETDEPFVAILAAGTSDLNVAEEAAEVCVAMGVAHEKVFDVGVAGLQRLLSRLEVLQRATALVVIAGMEGALPSVVAGLVGKPLFAVPTSVGYGASLGGVTALLAMLNSCAPGVTVVNIDNGFSAAYAACNVVWAVRDAQDEARSK